MKKQLDYISAFVALAIAASSYADSTTELMVGSAPSSFKKATYHQNEPVKIQQQASFTDNASQWYAPRISAGPFYSSDVDYFGLFDAFVPFTIDRQHIVFIDGRYHANHGTTSEGNLGAGTRNIFFHNKLMWGLYGFYDHRVSKTSNVFEQVTVGGELMSEDFSLSANGYIPVGATTQRANQYNQAILVQNGAYQNILYALGQEKSLYGFDALAGYRIPHTHGLALFVGGFHYWRNQTQSLSGPIIHGLYQVAMQDYHQIPKIIRHFQVNLVADYQYDSVRKSRWFAGIRLDFLMKAQKLQGVEQRMLDFVRRDLNVETEAATPQYKVFSMNGHVARVRQVNTEGTWNTARTDVATDIIGVNGTITGVAADATSPNQTITGNGFSFIAEGQQFSVPIGSNGNLTNGGGNLLVPAINNTIQNITLSGAAVQLAPVAGAVGNLVVDHVVSTGTGLFNSLGVTADASVTVRNSRITGTGTAIGLGTNAAAATLTVNIDNNVITSSTQSALLIVPGAVSPAGTTTGNITNNTITGQTSGLRFGLGVVGTVNYNLTNISNNRIHGVTEQGVFLDIGDGSMNIGTFSNNIISTDGAAFNALLVLSETGTTAFNNFLNNTFIKVAGSAANAMAVTHVGAGAGASSFANMSGNNFIGGNAVNVQVTPGTNTITFLVGQDPTLCFSAANNNATTAGGAILSPC